MLSILRIVSALVFITAGSMKVLGYPSSTVPMPSIPAFSQMWIGGWLEIIGGVLLLFGLFTRPVAFILAGEMAVAYFQFHYPQSFFPTVNNGVGAVLFCFIYLYFVFAGAGPWSVDAAIAGSRRAP